MKLGSSSKLAADKALYIIGGGGLILLLAAVAIFIYVGTHANYDKEYISLAGEQRVLSQSLVKDAVESASARVEAFKSLKQARTSFEHNLKLLREGNPETGLPATPEAAQSALVEVEKQWKEFSNNADTVLGSEGTIRMLSEFVGAINEAMPNLLALSDEVVSIMIESGASASQVYVASRQLMLVPRISVNANRVLAGGEGSKAAAERFGRDAALFGRVLEAMLKGNRRMNISRVNDPDAREKLAEVTKNFESVHELVGRVLEQVPTLFKAQKASTDMTKASAKLLQATTALQNNYGRLEEGRPLSGTLANMLGAAALLLFIWLGVKIQAETKARLAETADANRRNQDAIMRLLDEIGDLANGDLTAQATVSEDITGAIADAINYTIDQLRRLVST
ncbi:type IV pili methyl-accepting chemotaxis transducer N-terminal domain-containing protein, partial [Kaarinaea lacus]